MQQVVLMRFLMSALQTGEESSESKLKNKKLQQHTKHSLTKDGPCPSAWQPSMLWQPDVLPQPPTLLILCMPHSTEFHAAAVDAAPAGSPDGSDEGPAGSLPAESGGA